ncbi:MAG: gliding motility-associated C-terminal domain-containing protein [Crocinitomicaceae bacterium]|nr:gliding motility-associated C-terminal domain-containing protein [Flavobacteriales bacterium]NQZ35041.1 gliding motility-associated C-terminal domain-containing protein [Crocinitomicaceae bacterium]
MRLLFRFDTLRVIIEKIKWRITALRLVNTLTVFLLACVFHVNSQCTIIPSAIPTVSLGFVQTGGTNASGVAFNPNLSLYYAGIAGNPGFPLETFDAAGTPLFQTNTGFDIRGMWWNFNLDQLESNGYNANGVWTFNLNGTGYALNTGTNIFTGMNQPTSQSVGDYNCIEDEIWYYNAGTIQKRDHSTGALLSTLAITGLPVGTGNLNNNSVFYTDCLGHEIGLVDYQLKRIYFADKVTGAYSGMSQLPATTVINNSFRASWANGLAFLYDVGTRTWFGFQVLTGFNIDCSVVACIPPLLITDDLIACSPSMVDLTTGINAGSGIGNAQFYASLANANGSMNPISNMVSVSGTYYVGYEDPLDASCFSVDSILVTVNPIYNLIDNVSTCQNSTVTYPDGSTATITASTSYTSNLTTVAGCDSIIVTNVTMGPIGNITSNVNACENSTVTYPDGSTATITASTSYTSNLINAAGCDSIIVTNVTMDAIYNLINNVNACENSTVTYPDGSTATITASTSYTSNLTTVTGCDSVIVTNVTMDPIYNLINSVNACENSTVTYPDGSTAIITASTVYTSNLTTVAGCDSVIVTNVTMDPIYNLINNVNACENSTVTYPDGSTATITASTAYTSNLTTVVGCDSIIVTNVTMDPIYTFTSNVNACENSTVTYPDGSTEVITASTSYTSTLTTVDGCDSLIVTNVTVSFSTSSTVNETVCFGTQYTSPQGNSYGPGSFSETLVSAIGCDSVVTYVVTEIAPITSTINENVCFGEQYTSSNGTIYSGGTYTEILTAVSGCDSVVTINVSEFNRVTASFLENEANLTTLNPEVTFTNTSEGADAYVWTFGDGSPQSFEESPIHLYPYFESTTYIVTLIAINQAGCSDTISQLIFIEEELIYFVPNTFTPDGDALNNTFEPVFTSGHDPFDYSLLIFNRWGQLIFESHDATIGWDGTYNGRFVQEGTYTWKLEFKLSSSDERKIDVGHIIMMR